MESGALFEISGTVPINASWQEDIYFSEEGAASILTGLSFKMTFRADPNQDSADYTLSTDDGTLAIANDDDGYARVLRISVDPGTFSNTGDYVCDLASQDVSDVVTLWAHGTVSFRKNPVTF